MTDMPIRLAIYSDRLEIESPGTLPHGMTVEQLKSGMSRPRNRVIARVLRELDVMEAWGSGYRRICESCHRLEHPLPEWHEVGPAIRTIFAQHPETRVRPEAAVQTNVQTNVQISDLIPEDTLRQLDERQRWFVEQLVARERLRPASIVAQWGVSEKQAYRDVRALRELGVVEYVGPRKTGEWRLISG